MTAEKRLLKDLSKMQKSDGENGAFAQPVDDDLFTWEAVIYGSPDTIWEGGVFNLQLKFTNEYPNKAPKVKFMNEMYHPNIYNDGSICLDILSHNWQPVYDVSTILIAIQALLNDPNVNAPANNTAAEIFAKDK